MSRRRQPCSTSAIGLTVSHVLLERDEQLRACADYLAEAAAGLARRVHTCRTLVLVTFRPEDAAASRSLRILLGDTA